MAGNWNADAKSMFIKEEKDEDNLCRDPVCVNCSKVIEWSSRTWWSKQRKIERHREGKSIQAKLNLDIRNVTVEEALITFFDVNIEQDNAYICTVCYNALTCYVRIRRKAEMKRKEFVKLMCDGGCVSRQLKRKHEEDSLQPTKKQKLEMEIKKMKREKRDNYLKVTGYAQKHLKIHQAINCGNMYTAVRHLSKYIRGKRAILRHTNNLIKEEIKAYKKSAVISKQPLTLSNIQTFSFSSLNNELKLGLPILHDIISSASTTTTTTITNHVPCIISSILGSRNGNRVFGFLPKLIGLLLSYAGKGHLTTAAFSSVGLSVGKEASKRVVDIIQKETDKTSEGWVLENLDDLVGEGGAFGEIKIPSLSGEKCGFPSGESSQNTTLVDQEVLENVSDKTQVAAESDGIVETPGGKHKNMECLDKEAARLESVRCLRKLMVQKFTSKC